MVVLLVHIVSLLPPSNDGLGAVAAVTLVVPVPVQPPASVTVTVTVPAVLRTIVGVLSPVLQLYTL